MHLQWGPWVKRPGITFKKKEKARSDSVNMYYSKGDFERDRQIYCGKRMFT